MTLCLVGDPTGEMEKMVPVTHNKERKITPVLRKSELKLLLDFFLFV